VCYGTVERAAAAGVAPGVATGAGWWPAGTVAPRDEEGAVQLGGSPKPNQAYYDEFSDWYERERHRGYHALLDRLEVELVAPHCPGRTLLDAGCGTGLILEKLRPLASCPVGVDLSAGMLRRARSRGLSVVQASLTSLPFAEATFDVVCSFKVLAHVEDIDAALVELTRVCKPGGRLFLEFYNPWSLRYLGKLVVAGRISARTSEREVFTRWDTVRRLRGYLPAGLQLRALHGVRVLTPFAGLHRVPLLGRLLAAGEKLAVRSPLRYFGGFVVAECSKVA